MPALVCKNQKLAINRDDVVNVANFLLLIKVNFQPTLSISSNLRSVDKQSLVLLCDDKFSQIFAEDAKIDHTIGLFKRISQLVDGTNRLFVLLIIESNHLLVGEEKKLRLVARIEHELGADAVKVEREVAELANVQQPEVAALIALIDGQICDNLLSKLVEPDRHADSVAGG